MKKAICILSIASMLFAQGVTVAFAGPNDVYDGDNDTMATASEFRYPIDIPTSIGGPPKTLSSTDTVDWYKFRPARDGDLHISVNPNEFGPEHDDYDFNPDLGFKCYIYSDYGQKLVRSTSYSAGKESIRDLKVYDDRYYYLKVVRTKGSGEYFITTSVND